MRNFLCMTVMAATLSLANIGGAFAAGPVVWSLYGTFVGGTSTIAGTITVEGNDVVDWKIVTGSNYFSDDTFTGTPLLDGNYSMVDSTTYEFDSDELGYSVLRLSFAFDIRSSGNELLGRAAMVEGSYETIVDDSVTAVNEGYAQVPEPASLALLGVGILAVGSVVRRRRG